jgi:hypothetical protein
MKSIWMMPVLLLFLSGCSEPHSSSQPPIMEWQGEWGQWSADGHGRIYGASISIFSCDATALTCRFRYDSESPGSSVCRSSGKDGGLLRISDSRAKAQFLDYDGAPADCYLEIEKIQSPGKKELRLLSRSGGKCLSYCSGEPNFPSLYPFQSETVYPDLATRDCFADSRRSRQIWCRDQKVQEFDQQLEGFRLEIQRLSHTDELSRFRKIREEILAKCDGVADPKDCLLSAYTNSIAEMQLSEKNARETRDRDAKAIRTRGDPAQGSKLIDRLEGVYKRAFQNSTAAGGKYTSENILEIVRVSEDTVYFRTHLEAFNTSLCGLAGLARYSSKGVLVFEDPELPPDSADEPCMLQIEETAKEIRMLDPSHSCTRLHCGVRGGFHLQSFPLSSRSPIGYMEVLKNSKEYQKALKQWKQ